MHYGMAKVIFVMNHYQEKRFIQEKPENFK